MKKRKKRKKALTPKKPAEKWELSWETKKGIILVFLFAFTGLTFLALFQVAGRFGIFLVKAMRFFFGSAYFLFPFLMLAVLYFSFISRRQKVKLIHKIGIALFFLSVFGFLHLSIPLSQSVSAALNGQGGGVCGLAGSYFLKYFLGKWGAGIILLSLIIVSFLLVFNTSLDKIFFVFKIFPKLFSSLRSRKESDEAEEENEEEESEDEPEEKKQNLVFTKKEIVSSSENAAEPAAKSSEKKEEENFMSSLQLFSKKKNIQIPLNLLDGNSSQPTSGDIKKNVHIIKKTLENFGIEVEMGEVSVGPTVTQYTFKPAEGIKLSRIVSLSNDLALALAAHPIRIEAPIPGKSLVGIEVPNKVVAKVRLRDIISSPEFRKRKSNLMITLGKDVSGKTWMIDLRSNPHLLIAGSTGSGKTICINSLVLSLMYQNSPQDLKFIMVDPKRVELPVYNKTPYLAVPVITNVKQTIIALRWAIGEMERRFEKLSEVGSRDILSYRKKGYEMPSLVIVIDELADLMAAAGSEMEALIVRLAQMSRAVGIYLILATQRPSVNVITGLIKANITSRIAFSVASLTDSRTILDSSGAEKLLGKGDMLFVSAEISKPKRLQGAFVSEEEIRRVVNFLKEQYTEVEYNDEILQKPEPEAGGQINGYGQIDQDEELVEEAKKIISKLDYASASYLQRCLRIGYNRAARILDALEAQGIIAPSEGLNKPRKVLKREALEEDLSSSQETNEENYGE